MAFKLEFKSIVFSLCVVLLLTLRFLPLIMLEKMLLYFACLAYALWYAYDSYLLYQIESPGELQEMYRKSHEKIVKKQLKKESKKYGNE